MEVPMDEGANALTPEPYLDDGEHWSGQTRTANRPQSLATLQTLDVLSHAEPPCAQMHVTRDMGRLGRTSWPISRTPILLVSNQVAGLSVLIRDTGAVKSGGGDGVAARGTDEDVGEVDAGEAWAPLEDFLKLFG